MLVNTGQLGSLDYAELEAIKSAIDKEFDKRIDVMVSAKVDKVNHILHQLFRVMEDLEDFCKEHNIKIGENNDGLFPSQVDEIGYDPETVGREVFIYE